jgi:hypothetical protein
VLSDEELLVAYDKGVAEVLLSGGTGIMCLRGGLRALEAAVLAKHAARVADRRVTLPDCMMPDGADPCVAFQRLHAPRLDDLASWLPDYSYDSTWEPEEVVSRACRVFSVLQDIGIDVKEIYRRADRRHGWQGADRE